VTKKVGQDEKRQTGAAESVSCMRTFASAVRMLVRA